MPELQGVFCDICFDGHETKDCKAIENIALVFHRSGFVACGNTEYYIQENGFRPMYFACNGRLLRYAHSMKPVGTYVFNRPATYLVKWAGDYLKHVDSSIVLEHTLRLIHAGRRLLGILGQEELSTHSIQHSDTTHAEADA